jgi:hypothetical protein
MYGPGYLVYYTVLGSIGMIALVLLGLHRALVKADWSARERGEVVRRSALFLIGWFVATAVLASLGAYQGGGRAIPTIQFGLLVPILVGAGLIWRSPTASRIIDAVPQHWLVGAQFFRVLGLVFVALWAAGRLPGQFALPAGLGDLAVGLLAPVVAWAYARHPSEHTGSVLAWNLFGIADLVVAVATGFLTAPSPFQLLALDAPNVLIDRFPLVLIPVFLVPLSIVLHLASLRKLSGMAVQGGRPSSSPAASV